MVEAGRGMEGKLEVKVHLECCSKGASVQGGGCYMGHGYSNGYRDASCRLYST